MFRVYGIVTCCIAMRLKKVLKRWVIPGFHHFTCKLNTPLVNHPNHQNTLKIIPILQITFFCFSPKNKFVGRQASETSIFAETSFFWFTRGFDYVFFFQISQIEVFRFPRTICERELWNLCRNPPRKPFYQPIVPLYVTGLGHETRMAQKGQPEGIGIQSLLIEAYSPQTDWVRIQIIEHIFKAIWEYQPPMGLKCAPSGWAPPTT